MSALKVTIVVADFYADITEAMLAECQNALQKHGAEASIMRVPGAMEIPFALNLAADANPPPQAMVALGCVIRGETYHFETVADVSARGILQVQLSRGIPVANGVLTVENKAQAMARIGKAAAAAETALKMAALRRG